MTSGWNEAALQYQYSQGLSELLRDELARVETPVTLEGLIQLANQLNRRLQECYHWLVLSSMSVPSTSALVESEPMQIGLVRSALSTEERLRHRRANLCLYCGGMGHFLRKCPIRHGKPSSHTTVLYQVAATSPFTLFSLFLSRWWTR